MEMIREFTTNLLSIRGAAVTILAAGICFFFARKLPRQSGIGLSLFLIVFFLFLFNPGSSHLATIAFGMSVGSVAGVIFQKQEEPSEESRDPATEQPEK